MKKLLMHLRTMCLMAMMCMMSQNGWAYSRYQGGDIFLNEWWGGDKIIVVDYNTTVSQCNLYGGVLIIKEGVTVTVTDQFYASGSTIYLFGTLDIEVEEHSDLINCSIYLTGDGDIDGRYYDTDTYFSWVDSSNIGSSRAIAAQKPDQSNNYQGWPEYYEKVIYSSGNTDFYPFGEYYEDEARKHPIANLELMKKYYSSGYQAGYDNGFSVGSENSLPAPTRPGLRMVVTKKANGEEPAKEYEFDTREVESVEYREVYE